MATVAVTIRASPAEVFAVLADGWAYAGWVVGASHVRAVESGWPAAGSRLHHASGSWPVVMRDETRVEQVDPGRRLVLLACGGGLGDARVDLSLVPVGSQTRVTMVEEPVSGPGKWFHNRVADAALHRRNSESLARLTCLVERPTSPTK
jgi:uncharacterized protein YndB with AHSA1/START domain